MSHASRRPPELQERVDAVRAAKKRQAELRLRVAIDDRDAEAQLELADVEASLDPGELALLRYDLEADFQAYRGAHENDLALLRWNPEPDHHLVAAGQRKKNEERGLGAFTDAEVQTRQHPGYVEGMGIEGVHFRRVRPQGRQKNDFELTDDEKT